MYYQLNYQKGLYFDHPLELERAYELLKANGFSTSKVEPVSTYEAMMKLKNEALVNEYRLRF